MARWTIILKPYALLGILLVPRVLGVIIDGEKIISSINAGLARGAPGLMAPGVVGRIPGPALVSTDDDDDPDIILSTNVMATSSVGGLPPVGQVPGFMGGASLLTTGPGSASANIGGTYDIMGAVGGVGQLGGIGIDVGGLGVDLGLTTDLVGTVPAAPPYFLSRGKGLGRGLINIERAPAVGPKLKYVRPNRGSTYHGPKRRRRPIFRPFGKHRRFPGWKRPFPRFFAPKFPKFPMFRKFPKFPKFRKRFPFFG